MESQTAALLVALISIISLSGMIFPNKIKIDKSGWALFGGFFTWIVVVLYLDHSEYEAMTQGAMLSIIGVVLFLFSAMTIVEGIDHHGGFSVITRYIKTRDKDKLLIAVSLITFFLSATLDNLTTSIVMGSLVLKLMRTKEDQLIFACVVIAAANIGGVWSPIGNTTSILLWVGQQMSAGAMVTKLIIPSFVALSVLIFWFTIKMNGNVTPPDLNEFSVAEGNLHLPLKEKVFILLLGLSSLAMAPICKIFFHVQPFVGMIGGLVLYQVGTGIYHMKKGTDYQSHYHIRSVLKHVDTSTLYFFTGILMTVAANAEFGNLSYLAIKLDAGATMLLGTEMKNWGITSVIGLVSGVIPNTPIVAAAQEMYTDLSIYPQDGLFWQLLTYTSGVGGSLFLLGSAAGVVMTAIHKGLTFGKYMKVMTVPAFLAYAAGLGALYVQNLILTM